MRLRACLRSRALPYTSARTRALPDALVPIRVRTRSRSPLHTYALILVRLRARTRVLTIRQWSAVGASAPVSRAGRSNLGGGNKQRIGAVRNGTGTEIEKTLT